MRSLSSTLAVFVMVSFVEGCSEGRRDGPTAPATTTAPSGSQLDPPNEEHQGTSRPRDGLTTSRLKLQDASTAHAHAPTQATDGSIDGAASSSVDDVKLHHKAIVIDTHNDVTLRLIDQPSFDFGKRNADGHTDLVRMFEGGLDAEFLAVWVKPRDFPGEKGWDRSMAMFDAIHKTALAHQDKIVLARSASDIRSAVGQGKVAILIGVEGAHALGKFGTDAKALARLRQWRERGALYLTLTWMNSNALGGSSGDAGRDRGLTELGRKAITAMNDMGMIVDVSHVSDPTFFDALEASRLPVLASHSGVRAIHDHYRNLTDDMLRAIAKNNGAACIVYYPGFLDANWAAARRKARRTGGEIEADPVTIATVANHIDHAVKVAGVDHVCLGSDFDGIGHPPVGLEDVSKLPALTAELVRRGYSEEDTRKILGENVLRVLEANERGALVRTNPGP